MQKIILVCLVLLGSCSRKIDITPGEIAGQVGEYIYPVCVGLKGVPGQMYLVDYSQHLLNHAARDAGIQVEVPESELVVLGASGESKYCYSLKFPQGEIHEESREVEFADGEILTVTTAEHTAGLANYVRRLYNWILNKNFAAPDVGSDAH